MDLTLLANRSCSVGFTDNLYEGIKDFLFRCEESNILDIAFKSEKLVGAKQDSINMFWPCKLELDSSDVKEEWRRREIKFAILMSKLVDNDCLVGLSQSRCDGGADIIIWKKNKLLYEVELLIDIKGSNGNYHVSDELLEKLKSRKGKCKLIKVLTDAHINDTYEDSKSYVVKLTDENLLLNASMACLKGCSHKKSALKVTNYYLDNLKITA